MITTTSSSTGGSTKSSGIWRAAGIGGLAAAVVTTVLAAIARSQDVLLDIGSQHVRPAMFAVFTAIGAVLGALCALAAERRLAYPRRTFVVATVVLTAISVLPDLVADATTATKTVLVIAHGVAAAIIIPAIASQMSISRIVSVVPT